jgi:plastocyanin
MLLASSGAVLVATGDVVIHMVSDPDGSQVGFDPIGLLIQPGQTVRWVCDANVHTTTAYHPANDRHALRIPQAAQPWDSSFMMPGQTFAVRLTEPGVYDYFCAPHEMAGMVGRIIVDHPDGPGTLPFDYFLELPRPPNWQDVPLAARAAFPKIDLIMQKHRIPLAATRS